MAILVGKTGCDLIVIGKEEAIQTVVAPQQGNAAPNKHGQQDRKIGLQQRFVEHLIKTTCHFPMSHLYMAEATTF